MSFLTEGISKPLVAPRGNYIKEMPREKGSVSIQNLGSVLNWLITDQLHAYKNNRGDGRVSKRTSDSAYAGVKGDSLGECTIGEIRLENGRKVMALADFHSRLFGFLRRYVDGLMTEKELRTSISVRVVDEHLLSYQELNSSDPHKNKDKIKNPDLAYGPVLKKIQDTMGKDCMSLIGNNKWTILSSIIFNLANGEKEWNWPDVYQQRGKAGKLANNKADHFNISQHDLKRLCEAIQFWYDLMMLVSEQANKIGNPSIFQKIIGNAGMFGFIVCDRMLDKPRFSNVKILANKIIREVDIVSKACPDLCRGTRITVLQFSTRLSELFSIRRSEDQ